MGLRVQLLIGYSASLAIAALATTFSVLALQASARDETHLAHQYADDLLEVERLRFAAEHVVATARGYLVNHDETGRARSSAAIRELDERIDGLLATRSWRAMSELPAIRSAAHDYADMARKLANDDPPDVARALDQQLRPARAELQDRLQALARRERASFEATIASARESATRAGMLVGLIGGIGLALSAALAAILIRRVARLHSAQREAVAEARRAAEAREEVLAIVSHDLRNPLATVVTASDLLAITIRQPDARRQLDILRFAADRMRHLVDQIVDTEQIDAGRLRLDVRRCDIVQLLRDVADQFADAAAKHGVALRHELPDDPVFVIADSERVAQVLSNLLGNALRFTPADGTVTLAAKPCADTVEISVEDSGPGIPPEEVEHLFDRYWRGARSESSRGLGLGLYICKRLVEAHRGHIWVAMRSSQGTCFRFTLPRELGPATRSSAAPLEPGMLRD